VDVDLDYAIDSARGKWTFGLNGTYTFVQDQQITATAPVFDFVNTVGNPIKLRWAGHLSWSFKGWTVLTTVNHTAPSRIRAPCRRAAWMSGTFGYEAANASLVGRQISLQIVKRWGR